MTSATPSTLIKQIYKDLGRADKGREPSIKLLYVTPERLGNSDSMLNFMHRLHDQVSRVVVVVVVVVLTSSHCHNQSSPWSQDRLQYLLK